MDRGDGRPASCPPISVDSGVVKNCTTREDDGEAVYLLSALFAHTLLMPENQPVARNLRTGSNFGTGVLVNRILRLLIKQYGSGGKREFHPWTEALIEDYMTAASGIKTLSMPEIKEALDELYKDVPGLTCSAR